MPMAVYIGRRDVTVICGHTMISTLRGNVIYCLKLSGEDLSCYSNKIEDRCSYHCMWCQNNKRFSQLAPHHGKKTAGVDTVWRNYVTVTLCTSQWLSWQAQMCLVGFDPRISHATVRHVTWPLRHANNDASKQDM